MRRDGVRVNVGGGRGLAPRPLVNKTLHYIKHHNNDSRVNLSTTMGQHKSTSCKSKQVKPSRLDRDLHDKAVQP